jgi:hypothetical protein
VGTAAPREAPTPVIASFAYLPARTALHAGGEKRSTHLSASSRVRPTEGSVCTSRAATSGRSMGSSSSTSNDSGEAVSTHVEISCAHEAVRRRGVAPIGIGRPRDAKSSPMRGSGNALRHVVDSTIGCEPNDSLAYLTGWWASAPESAGYAASWERNGAEPQQETGP